MPEQMVTEEHPLPDTIDEIMATVGRILSQGGVQLLVMNEGEPIFVERMKQVTKTDMVDGPDLMAFTLEDMLNRIPLAEYTPPTPNMDPGAQVFEMFTLMSSGGYVPSHALCQNKAMLAQWLGLAGVLPKEYRLINARVTESPMMPPNALVVFGGHWAGAAPPDVKVGLKLTIGATHETESHEPPREAWDPAPADAGGAGRPQGHSGGHGVPTWFGPQSS